VAGQQQQKTYGIPDRVVYYHYRHDRARRTRRGTDEQVAKLRPNA
jgi:hypothetical protein